MKVRICPAGRQVSRDNLVHEIHEGVLPVWLAFAVFDQGLFYTARNQYRNHCRSANKSTAKPSDVLRRFVDRTSVLDSIDVVKLAALTEGLCKEPEFSKHLPSVLSLSQIRSYMRNKGWKFIALTKEQLVLFKSMVFATEHLPTSAEVLTVKEGDPVTALRSRMQHLKQEYSKAASALQLVIAQERDRIKQEYERRLAELDRPVEDWDDNTLTTSESVDRLQKLISL